MRITDVYVGYLKITRIIQIGSILVKHGFKEMISHTFLGRRIRKRRIRQHKPVYTTQERLRLTIEDLGPTYIKFGQILADRPDILSERFRKELKKLQTNALPFDDHLAIRLIEDELGAEIKDVFSEFNPHCIASASIGQVYTGRLKNGKDVVIKIRRPNIDQKIKLDLYLMRYLAKKLALEYPEMAAINIVGVVDEFGESIFKELNYYNEATNILRFRDIFKDNPRIYIPHVDMKHTTHRMLIMERIFGMSPDDPLQLKAAGLRVQLDDSDNSPGWKFAQYEMKGVPVRLEIGPRDIENGQCVLAPRVGGEKRTAALGDTLADTIQQLLQEVHDKMYEKALENREKHTYACRTLDEITKTLEEKGDGFVKAMWCGDEACEDKIKELTGVGSRCIPKQQEHLADTCICCGKPAKCMVYWGKAY